MLVRRAVFEKIGALNESFFAYWEDIDYSIRSHFAGFRNVAVPGASVYHVSKLTVDAADTVRPYYYYFMTRNEILMWRGFCSRLPYLKSVFWVLRRQLRQIRRMPHNVAGIDAILSGLWDGWLGFGGAYDPHRRMPLPIRMLFGRFTRIWAGLPDAKG